MKSEVWAFVAKRFRKKEMRGGEGRRDGPTFTLQNTMDGMNGMEMDGSPRFNRQSGYNRGEAASY